MKLFSSFLAAAITMTALPLAASAQDQPWLKDRRYAEGIGYRVGDFELHPGGAVEFGYDSNYLHNSSQEGVFPALRLRVTPSFSFSSLGDQRRIEGGGGSQPDVQFNGGMSLTYNEFFPLSDNVTKNEILRNERNVSGALNLTLNILPGQPWSGTIFGDISRSLSASDQGFDGDFNRIFPRAGAELAWTPGGGLFDWRLGYKFSGTIFEAAEFTRLTNVENTIETRGRWRFLPRTALMYDGRFGFITYTSPSSGSGATGNPKTDSHPLRARLGLNGQITPSFSLLVMAGWGASFYSASGGTAEDFDSVIGQLEVKWYLTPNPSADPGKATNTLSALSLGFLRDFEDSYIGTYFERDRGYAKFTYFFDGRFLLVIEGGAGPKVYPAIPLLNSGATKPAWTDVRADASIFGEYRIKDRFGINATVRYNGNLSVQSVNPTNDPTQTDYLGFHEIEAYLGGRWFM